MMLGLDIWSNIVIATETYWTCSQCCVICIWVVGSNIVIGLDILDMWSVLYVP